MIVGVFRNNLKRWQELADKQQERQDAEKKDAEKEAKDRAKTPQAKQIDTDAES
jgi:hypothetical protein